MAVAVLFASLTLFFAAAGVLLASGGSFGDWSHALLFFGFAGYSGLVAYYRLKDWLAVRRLNWIRRLVFTERKELRVFLELHGVDVANAAPRDVVAMIGIVKQYVAIREHKVRSTEIPTIINELLLLRGDP